MSTDMNNLLRLLFLSVIFTNVITESQKVSKKERCVSVKVVEKWMADKARSDSSFKKRLKSELEKNFEWIVAIWDKNGNGKYEYKGTFFAS